MSNTQLLTTNDSKWQELLPAKTSVFGSSEFARIYEKHSGYRAYLFILNTADSQIAHPFFRRPVKELPFINMNMTAYADAITPDYTGPITVFGDDSLVWKHHFDEAFSRFCLGEGIVTEFAHLHPWDARTDLLDAASVKYDREIVFVNLELSEDAIWNDSFSYACRKNIKRAQREEVQTFVAKTEADIRDFYRIYTDTMARNNALDKYYFSLDYFLGFFETMSLNAHFVLAEHQEKRVAATLYLHDEENVYSYLGGADHNAQRVRPTNAIIYDTILWAKQQGKKRLILGGGYKADDGIFRFKSSFSNLTKSFHTYKRIYLPTEYMLLCQKWTSHYGKDITATGYFPPYRSIP